MKKEYMIRFGSNSSVEIKMLTDEEYKHAVECGYQIIQLGGK